MADKEKPKRIIGMRSRVVIGNEVPEDDSDTKVLGQDVLVHVKPDQLEEGMEIVGVASTVVVGGSSASELIQATMERAKELDLPDSKKSSTSVSLLYLLKMSQLSRRGWRYLSSNVKASLHLLC